MKKIILSTLMVASLFLGGCESEDTGDVSRVTDFPVFTLLGEDLIFVDLGDTYTDPGAVAFEGEEEIEHTVSVSGRYRGGNSVDTNVADIYDVTYSAQNQDGFFGTATRTVIVSNTGNLVDNIEGLYRSTVFRNGTSGAQYTNMEYVLIWKNTDGSYEISDGFGGWYELGRALGLGYLSPGAKVIANDIPSNNFSFPNSYTNLGFGGTANLTGMTVNATNKTIDFTATWITPPPSTTYNFAVHLEQIQF